MQLTQVLYVYLSNDVGHALWIPLAMPLLQLKIYLRRSSDEGQALWIPFAVTDVVPPTSESAIPHRSALALPQRVVSAGAGGLSAAQYATLALCLAQSAPPVLSAPGAAAPEPRVPLALAGKEGL